MYYSTVIERYSCQPYSHTNNSNENLRHVKGQEGKPLLGRSNTRATQIFYLRLPLYLLHLSRERRA